jgi:6-phosphogluconolactonase
VQNFELISFGDAQGLAELAASNFLKAVLSANPSGTASQTVALSGGRISRAFFSTVEAWARKERKIFANVHFFWADERCVPPDDEESNFRVARELLLAPLGIADDHIHRIRGESAPEEAAVAAEAEICRIAPLTGDGQPELDLVLLGMGEDGHVASLFPGEPEPVMESPLVYRTVTAAKPPPRRVTIGYAAIAAARQVWVLASGQGKEEALHNSLDPSGITPLARVIRSRPRTRIFTDILTCQVPTEGPD